MRTSLQPFEGIRKTYIATVARHGVFMTQNGLRRKVLLKNIRDSGNQSLADHVSIADPASVKDMAALNEGDLIQFTALVYTYTKGYKGEDIEARLKRLIRIDYGLWNVRDLVKLNVSHRSRILRLTPSYDTLKKNKRIGIGVCM